MEIRVRELHGDIEKADSLAREALGYESEAADLIPEEESSEPSRSIFYRSAASLAYQSKEFNIARELIVKGLSGYPPPRIEEELYDLQEQINKEDYTAVVSKTMNVTEQELFGCFTF